MRELAKRALVGLAAATAAACATSSALPLQTSEYIPAASGRVEARRDGANTEVTVEVKHLAPPPRVSPGAAAWVVWVRQLGAPSAPAQNVGVLGLDDDLRGRLRTVTPLRDFEVFVTPEPSGMATTPSGPELLSARVARE